MHCLRKNSFVYYSIICLLFTFCWLFTCSSSTKPFRRSARNGNNNRNRANTKPPNITYAARYRNKQASHWFQAPNCYVQVNSAPPNNLCYFDNSTEVTCFGAKVTYEHAALSYSGGQNSLFSTYDATYVDYTGLPECWLSMREFICSIQFAPCHSSSGRIKLASRELCLRTAKKCHFLRQFFVNLWPSELDNCSDATIFTDSCTYLKTNPDPTVSWNDSVNPRCVHPLVLSKFESGWVLPGCAQNCTSHWLTASEHEYLRGFIGYCGVPVFGFTFFIWISFLIRKNCAGCANNSGGVRQYSHVSTVYAINTIGNNNGNGAVTRMPVYFSKPLSWYLFCHCLVLACWIMHLFPGLKSTLSCREDGSLRKFEIRPEHNLFCGLQFLCIYFGIIGASVWLVIFAYYLRQSYTVSRDLLETSFNRKLSWLHLALCTAVVLAVYPIAWDKVEADGISGICFIGYSEPWLTVLFVHIPVTVMFLAGLLLFVSGLVTRGRLFPAKSSAKLADQKFHLLNESATAANNIVAANDNNNSREYFSTLKLTLFFTVHALALAISWAIQLKTQNFAQEKRREALLTYIQCQMCRNLHNRHSHHQNSSENECELENRPDIRLIVLHILTFFISTLITDVCLFVGGDFCEIWTKLANRFCQFFKNLLFKRKNLHINNAKATTATNEIEMNRHRDQLTPTNQNGETGEEEENGHVTNNEFEMSSTELNNRSDLDLGHESQTSFRKRWANKGGNRRGTRSKLLKSTATTPSSLFSGSLSSMLNCSSSELPFSQESSAQGKSAKDHRNKFPSSNFVPHPFLQYYSVPPPPTANCWYPPMNSAASSMFYPFFVPPPVTQSTVQNVGGGTNNNTPSENNAAEFPSQPEQHSASTGIPFSAVPSNLPSSAVPPASSSLQFHPNFFPPPPFFPFPFPPAPYWPSSMTPFAVLPPPIFDGTAGKLADSSNGNEGKPTDSDENAQKKSTDKAINQSAEQPCSVEPSAEHDCDDDDNVEDTDEYKNSASDTGKCDSDSDSPPYSDSDAISCDSEEAALIEKQFEACMTMASNGVNGQSSTKG